MLAAHTELKSVFNAANQANGKQPTALAAALFAYATHIDDPGVLMSDVERMCQKHASLNISADQYPIVGEHLINALGKVLGNAVTPAVKDAWVAAYWQLADIMIKREKQIYDQQDQDPGSKVNHWHSGEWHEFVIAAKEPEAEGITSFYLKSKTSAPTQVVQHHQRSKLPSYLPGQYISVMVDVPALGHAQARQYSLSDVPGQDYYRITVKREDGLQLNLNDAISVEKVERHTGFVSNILHDTKNVGDTVLISHPAGEFTLAAVRHLRDSEEATAPVVFLGAGIGVTPLRSMLGALTAPAGSVGKTAADGSSVKRPISWIQGVHSSNMEAFRDDIEKLASQHSNLKATVFTEELGNSRQPISHEIQAVRHASGFVDLSKLDTTADLHIDNPATQFFICGGVPFMLDMRKSLLDYGVTNDRIHMELFGTGGVPVPK